MKMDVKLNTEIKGTADKVGGIMLIFLISRFWLSGAHIDSDPITQDVFNAMWQFGIYGVCFLIIYAMFKINIKDVFKRHERKLDRTIDIIALCIFMASFSIFFALVFAHFTGLLELASSKMEVMRDYNNEYLLTFGAVIGAFLEELLFRGIILEQLKKHGNVFAIIISSLIFGLMHGVMFTHTFVTGIIFGTAYVITGNIIWPILMHMYQNGGFDVLCMGIYKLVPSLSEINEVYSQIIILIGLIIISLAICIYLGVFKKIKIKEGFISLKASRKNEIHKYKEYFKSPIMSIIIVFQLISMVVGVIYLIK